MANTKYLIITTVGDVLPLLILMLAHKMRKRTISRLRKWAVKNRPSGYIEKLQSYCETWDDEKDQYTITDDNWNLLAKEYGQSKPNPTDTCQYRTCGGCAGGPQCSQTGNDCRYGPGTFNQCWRWRGINKI